MDEGQIVHKTAMTIHRMVAIRRRASTLDNTRSPGAKSSRRRKRVQPLEDLWDLGALGTSDQSA